MREARLIGLVCVGAACGVAVAADGPRGASAPIQVGFLWHMHQPIYYPYEPLSLSGPYFSFSPVDVHNQRFGPYTSWPRDAVNAGLSMAHLGAQVSFSGSLIENLNDLAAAGVNGGMWANWQGDYRAAQSSLTTLGNRRLEMVAFGYHHPLMPLLDERDIRMQIRLHEHVHAQAWQTGYSRGMFPPETAFSVNIIPAFVAEGVDWVLVDNIHFDRACVGYPHTDATGIAAPNRADQVNPDPAAGGGAWVQLNNLWAPSRVSAPFGYRPHHVQHVDPSTGQLTRIVAVPAARYEGNEDGRGGYGAFLYDQVMDAYLPYNTDPAHPMFVMLHHDGDNFGGGSDAYYHHNFQSMVAWASADPDYDVTTVEDYLERFPVDADDVIHVEPGSWAGADSGDPEFKKWLGGDVSAGGVSTDLNSWAVLTAAKNRVFTADDLAPYTGIQAIINGTGTATNRAWRWLLVGEASDYWYWDGSPEPWDSNVTRACNQAVVHANAAIGAMLGAETTPPTVFLPQREPYNPGGVEFGAVQPADFEVWTLAYDASGLSGVTLRWRMDADGVNPLASIQNETYAGGAEVGAWNSVAMAPASVPTPPGVLAPTYKAQRYGAMITGQRDVLIDYYVEAVDGRGAVQRSPIQHVWVGASDVGGGDAVAIDPDPAVAGQTVTISYDPGGGPLAGAGQVYLHHGFDNWGTVISPDPEMTWNAGEGVWRVGVGVPTTATALDMVFNDGAGTWDNNAGADWHFAVDGGEPGDTWEIDGSLDADAVLIATRGGLSLWAGLKGSTLYLATNPAGAGADRFLLLAGVPGAMGPAMWAKAGQVAAWDAFVGNEESNGWSGWFDASGAAQVAAASVLEATIDIAGELGSLPGSVHIAAAGYQSHDGGSLLAGQQIPAGNGDGSIQAGEYLEIELCALAEAGCCPADLADPKGVLDFSDVVAFLTAFAGGQAAADFAPPSGVFDFSDVVGFLAAFGAGCP